MCSFTKPTPNLTRIHPPPIRGHDVQKHSTVRGHGKCCQCENVTSYQCPIILTSLPFFHPVPKKVLMCVDSHFPKSCFSVQLISTYSFHSHKCPGPDSNIRMETSSARRRRTPRPPLSTRQQTFQLQSSTTIISCTSRHILQYM